MPPEAISRSSTYFPKIWGNTRFAYRTALLAVWLATGCTTPPPELTPRTIRARWIPGCEPDTTTGELDLEALGDFDPSPQTHVVVGIDAPDRAVGIPESTRSLVLAADTPQGSFKGVSGMPDVGAVSIPLWPAANACPLHAVSDGAYPQSLDGVGIGYSASASVVLVVGGSLSLTSPSATSALVIDLASGTVKPVEVGLPTPRIGPTVTPFGGKLLVAGGSDSDSAGKPSANVFDPVLRRFEEGRIDLDRGRARHAAVVLASGETLLVGGSNAENNALRGLEIVSPETGTSTANGLDLEIGRANPVAVRLTDDRILVAGGTRSDGMTPVETLEWFSPNATSREPQSLSLATGGTATAPVADRAFVAMPGGSALGVGGCELTQTSDCVACTTSAGSGCASKDVYWITRDGSIETLPALDAAAHPTLLVAGAGGHPWLIAGSSNGRRLLRFDPWRGRFAQPDETPPPPLAGFEFEPGATAFEARIIGADPGLFLWLSGSDQNLPAIYGYRHGTRGPYDATIVPLLLANQDGVALDRKNEGENGGLDPGSGNVVLKDGGPTLVVTDTTYADFGLSIALGDPTPPSDLPTVVLFASEAGQVDGRTYGDAACPWPSPPAGKPLAPRLRRIGATVTLTQGGKETTCVGPPGRVSISFRSPGGDVRIQSIDVKRSL